MRIACSAASAESARTHISIDPLWMDPHWSDPVWIGPTPTERTLTDAVWTVDARARGPEPDVGCPPEPMPAAPAQRGADRCGSTTRA